MSSNNWHGIMIVKEIQHLSSSGDILWEAKNLKNLLMNEGEQFMLDVVFAGGDLPTSYYLGLDNRATISVTDTITSLVGEPTFGGYSRQAVNDFTIIFETNWRAVSPIVAFSADSSGAGTGWGPVRNLFLATGAGTGSGTVLISSTDLGTSISLSPGESVTMRMQLTMQDCS